MSAPLLTLILTVCLWQCLPGFSTVKLACFSPSSCRTCWEENHCAQPTFEEEGSFASPLWGGSIYINYLVLFCVVDLSLLPHICIDSIIYQYGLIVTLSTLGYNALLYFVVQTILVLVTGNSSCCLLCPFNNPIVKLWIFFNISYFLVL